MVTSIIFWYNSILFAKENSMEALSYFKKLTILTIIIAPIAFANNHSNIGSMLEKITPSIVNIQVEKLLPPHLIRGNKDASSDKHMFELGSGVILDEKQGLIVTNSHVIHDANTILVKLKSGSEYLAKTIGEDVESDLALLKIHAKNLTKISIGKSSQLSVGDQVIAIGNPFGLQQTVTSGIVSGLHRNTTSNTNDFIQTDAPINPGSSGGALVNTKGELIGINTAILSRNGMGNIGIGFAIPSDMMIKIVDQLFKYGNVERGLLGVTLQELTPSLAVALKSKTDHGAIINSIAKYSAAEKAGLQKGDIITKIDDLGIYTADEAKSYVSVLRKDTTIEIKAERNNKSVTKQATIADIKQIDNKNMFEGLTLINFDAIDSHSKRISGLMVTDVKNGSRVWLAGLSKGDIITKINKHIITNLDEIANINDNSALIEVQRGISSYLLVVE
jgi:serine protease Do